jgi:hypothetical protein
MQVYLTTLEVTKSATTKLGQQFEFSETTTAGIANAAGGAAASLSTQIITVGVIPQSSFEMQTQLYQHFLLHRVH